MKTTTLVSASLALMLPACESVPDPLSVDAPPAAAVLAPSSALVAELTAPTLEITQVSRGTSQPLGWCDEAAGVALVSVPGTGTATHVGRFDVRQTTCLDPVNGTMTGGEATLVAANGDEIHMAWQGQVVPGLAPPTFDTEYEIVGGTGRFARAEGEVDIRVVQSTPSTWTSSGSGWIRYAASDRSVR